MGAREKFEVRPLDRAPCSLRVWFLEVSFFWPFSLFEGDGGGRAGVAGSSAREGGKGVFFSLTRSVPGWFRRFGRSRKWVLLPSQQRFWGERTASKQTEMVLRISKTKAKIELCVPQSKFFGVT